VGVVTDDRLGVRLIPGQIGGRRLRRVVRVLVRRDDLVTRADREQHLGGGWRQRDDLLGGLGDLDGLPVAFHRDRERRLCRRGGWGRAVGCGPSGVVVATGGQQQRHHN